MFTMSFYSVKNAYRVRRGCYGRLCFTLGNAIDVKEEPCAITLHNFKLEEKMQVLAMNDKLIYMYGL